MSEAMTKALIAFQAEAPKIELDSTNPHFHSRYPSLAGIMERVRPLTAKHGIAVVQYPTTLDGEPALTTTLLHESGDDLTATMPLLPVKRDPQGLGSAITYARRYMVLSMLGLVGDEDDDANAATPAPGDAVEQQMQTGFASDKQKNLFRRLLKEGGLDSNQVEGVVRYAENDLPSVRISKAIGGLKQKDQPERDKVIEALLSESIKWAATQSDVPYDDSQ